MSERAIQTDLAAAVDAPVVVPFFAIDADFPSGPVRCWSGFGDLTFDAKTFAGVGEFLGVAAPAETIDTSANGIALTLSGIPPEVFDPVTVDHYHGRSCKVWLGALDPDDWTLDGDPLVIFSGRMDSDDVVDSGSSLTVTLTVEHRLADLLRPREYRYNEQSHHALRGATTDRGFEFVASLREAKIRWGG